MVSSTVGSPTNTGWKRRASAASFSMCLRYSSSVVAPTQCSSPRASAGLSRLEASIAPSALPAPTSVCISSMNRMISPSARVDLVQHRLQPLLELAAVLRAGDQRAHVERHQLLVLQRLRHVAVDDAQRQALDDGGLADAGLADQHRVVLGAARQHLDGAADLLVAADHRVELAVAGRLGEVAGVFLQRVVAVLGVRAVDGPALAHVADRLLQRLRRRRRRLQRTGRPACRSRRAPAAAGPAPRTRRRPWRRLLRGVEHAHHLGRHLRLAGAAALHLRQLAPARPRRPAARPAGRRPRRGSGPAAAPSSSSSSAFSRCSGVSRWWNSRMAIVCAACRKPRERSVNFSMSICWCPSRSGDWPATRPS